MEVDSYKCYFTNCTAPPDPDTIPPTCTRASDAALYSDTTIWDMDSDGYVSNVGTGTSGLPQTGQKVKIMKGKAKIYFTDIIVTIIYTQKVIMKDMDFIFYMILHNFNSCNFSKKVETI
jgi:hypothetical protein